MIKIKYKCNNNEIIIHAESNQKLRDILIENSIYPYNGIAKYLNCRGLGSCGTCAVSIFEKSKEYDFSKLKNIEQIRLNFVPHNKVKTINNHLRLACQYIVDSDINVLKNDGFWGQK